MSEKNFTFKTNDGLDLAARYWLPEEEAKAVVVLAHGIAEHKGRYAHLAEAYNQAGIAFAGYDHRGHGESPGDRIVVFSFDQLSTDLETFIQLVEAEFPGKPVFVFGHSMGTLVAGNFATSWESNVKGFLFSAMATIMSTDVPQWMVAMSGIIAAVLPKVRLLTLDSAGISHDPDVVKDYDTDPLNFRGGVPAVTGARMLEVGEKIVANASRLQKPVLVLHGADDTMVSPEGSQLFYDGVGSDDKTLKYYDGMFHEIINEIGKEEPIGDLVKWVTDRI